MDLLPNRPIYFIIVVPEGVNEMRGEDHPYSDFPLVVPPCSANIQHPRGTTFVPPSGACSPSTSCPTTWRELPHLQAVARHLLISHTCPQRCPAETPPAYKQPPRMECMSD